MGEKRTRPPSAPSGVAPENGNTKEKRKRLPSSASAEDAERKRYNALLARQKEALMSFIHKPFVWASATEDGSAISCPRNPGEGTRRLPSLATRSGLTYGMQKASPVGAGRGSCAAPNFSSSEPSSDSPVGFASGLALATPPATPLGGDSSTRPPKITLRISVPDGVAPTSDDDQAPLSLLEQYKPAYHILDDCAKRLRPGPHDAADATITQDFDTRVKAGTSLCHIALDVRNGWRDAEIQLGERSREVAAVAVSEAAAVDRARRLNDEVKTLQTARDALEGQLREEEAKAAAELAALTAQRLAKDEECAEVVRVVRAERDRLEGELEQVVKTVNTIASDVKAIRLEADATIAEKDAECLAVVARTRSTNAAVQRRLAWSQMTIAGLHRQADARRSHYEHLIDAGIDGRKQLQQRLDEAMAAHQALATQYQQREASISLLHSAKDAEQVEIAMLQGKLVMLQETVTQRDSEIATMRTDLDEAGASLSDALSQEVEHKAAIVRLRKELADERSCLESAKAEHLAAERFAREAQDAQQRAEEGAEMHAREHTATVLQLRDRLSNEQMARRKADQAHNQALEQRDEARTARERTGAMLRQASVDSARRIADLERRVEVEREQRVAAEEQAQDLRRALAERRTVETKTTAMGSDVALFHAGRQLGVANFHPHRTDATSLSRDLRTAQAAALFREKAHRCQDRSDLDSLRIQLRGESAQAAELVKALAKLDAEKAEMDASLEPLRQGIEEARKKLAKAEEKLVGKDCEIAQLKHDVDEVTKVAAGEKAAAAASIFALQERLAAHETKANTDQQAMPLLHQISELTTTITVLDKALEEARTEIDRLKRSDQDCYASIAEAGRRELEDVRTWLEMKQLSVSAEQAKMAALQAEHAKLLREHAEVKAALERAEKVAGELRADAELASKDLDDLEMELNDAAAARRDDEDRWAEERATVAQRRGREIALWQAEGERGVSTAVDLVAGQVELRDLKERHARYAAEDDKVRWNVEQMAIVEAYRRKVEAGEAKLREVEKRLEEAEEALEAERVIAARQAGPSDETIDRVFHMVGKSEDLWRMVEGILWASRPDRGEDSDSSPRKL